jgi:hypothetical protein
MPRAPKKPYSFRRLKWIAAAAVITFCGYLGFIMFANRDNPSAVPTIRVEEIATAAANLASPTPPESAQVVQLSLLPYIAGKLLIVEGFTDLPNRAILMYEVSEVSPNPTVVEGTVPVLDGRYARQVNLTGWHAGAITVWVGFQTQLDGAEQQPIEVIERFGEMGEFLYGENVNETDGFKRVEIMKTLEYLQR